MLVQEVVERPRLSSSRFQKEQELLLPRTKKSMVKDMKRRVNQIEEVLEKSKVIQRKINPEVNVLFGVKSQR